MIVADADPAEVVKVVKDRFGGAPKRAKPAPESSGVKAYAQSFAVVASDAEINSESVQITRAEPARPPTTTVAQLRDELVLDLAETALNRRLDDKDREGRHELRERARVVGRRRGGDARLGGVGDRGARQVAWRARGARPRAPAGPSVRLHGARARRRPQAVRRRRRARRRDRGHGARTVARHAHERRRHVGRLDPLARPAPRAREPAPAHDHGRGGREALRGRVRPVGRGVRGRASRRQGRADRGATARDRHEGARGEADGGRRGRPRDEAPREAPEARGGDRGRGPRGDGRLVGLARERRARPLPAHGRAEERGHDRRHALRRRAPRDGREPRRHDGRAARVGAARHEVAHLERRPRAR